MTPNADLVSRLAPLGVPTSVRADDPALLATVRAAYAEWAVQAPSGPPVIELGLRTAMPPIAEVNPEICVEGPRLTLQGAGVRGWADAASKRAEGLAPPRLVGDPTALAAELTDTLLLFLLARSDRTPIHASGVLFGEEALVLAGPSGSGKSTLALAAMERGFRILSDDTLYIQLQPGVRVWGFPRPVHVFPEDAPRFTGATRLRGGKLKAAISVAAEARAPPVSDRARLILLARGERLDLRRIEPEAAIVQLGALDPGFDLLARESAQAVRMLAGRSAWRLTLSRDPAAAIDFLHERWAAGALAD